MARSRGRAASGTRSLPRAGAPRRSAADLASPQACRALIDEVLARFGRLDHLIASAAIFERIPFDEVDAEAWDRTMAINVRAPALLAQRAAPALRAHAARS